LEPTLLGQALDALLNGTENQRIQEKIALLEQQLAAVTTNDERLKKAYYAGAFDADEFTAERHRLKDARALLEEDIQQLSEKMITPAQVNARRAILEQTAAVARRQDGLTSATTDEKQRILKLLVDKILVNAKMKEIEIHGSIFPSGVVDMYSGDIYSQNASQLKYALRCDLAHNTFTALSVTV